MSVSFDSNLLLTRNEQYLAARKKLVNLDTINSLANLLAREDLTVVHDPSAPTASFVPSTRVLTLPTNRRGSKRSFAAAAAAASQSRSHGRSRGGGLRKKQQSVSSFFRQGSA